MTKPPPKLQGLLRKLRLSAWKQLAMGALALVVGFLAFTVWPTLYRYDHLNLGGSVYPVRINRFTGATYRFGTRGWVRPDKQTSIDRSLSPEELKQLETTKATLDKDGSLRLTIYNGSSKLITCITVFVALKDNDGKVILSRFYTLRSLIIPALSSDTIYRELELDFDLDKQTWSFRITSAEAH